MSSRIHSAILLTLVLAASAGDATAQSFGQDTLRNCRAEAERLTRSLRDFEQRINESTEQSQRRRERQDLPTLLRNLGGLQSYLSCLTKEARRDDRHLVSSKGSRQER